MYFVFKHGVVEGLRLAEMNLEDGDDSSVVFQGGVVEVEPAACPSPGRIDPCCGGQSGLGEPRASEKHPGFVSTWTRSWCVGAGEGVVSWGVACLDLWVKGGGDRAGRALYHFGWEDFGPGGGGSHLGIGGHVGSGAPLQVTGRWLWEHGKRRLSTWHW